MTISELRHLAGMSQRAFAEYFGIPVGTLRNWEQGIAKPPEYLFSMIFQSIRRDKMINVETMRLIKLLDELAVKSKNGIEDFQNATEASFDEKIFYASNCDCKVVADACIVDKEEYYHHDIISFHESLEYVIKVQWSEDDKEPFLVVEFAASEDEIIIENGKWYFV